MSDSAAAVASVDLKARNRRLGRHLAVVAVAMVVLVPILYWSGGVLCRALGIAINPADRASKVDPAAAASGSAARSVRAILRADATRVPGVAFWSDDRVQQVRIGEYSKTTFHLRNDSDTTVHIRPIHSVSPAAAARCFEMTVCFCFNDQVLAPGEEAHYPVVYRFTDGMDARVFEAHISYTLEPISADEMRPRTEPSQPGAKDAVP